MVINLQTMVERIRSNAEIDMLNSVLEEGQTPLPYEVEVAEDKAEDIISNEVEDKKEIKAEGEGDEIEAEDKKAPEVKAEKKEEKPEEEIDEDKILAYLTKKSGKEISSIEDFINPKAEVSDEERETAKVQAKEKRDSDKIAFGLSNGIFNSKELSSYATDTEKYQDFVFGVYAADQKAKDSELTDADIEEEFAFKFSTEDDKDSRSYQAGQNLLKNIAESLLQQKYPKIVSLENEYASFEQAQEAEQKIIKATPKYTKDVSAIKEELKSVSIEMGNETFDVELPSDTVDTIVSDLLNPHYAKMKIASGWDKKSLMETATVSAIMKSMPLILKKYADKEVLKHQAGTRGIAPQGRTGRDSKQVADLSADQQKALDYFKNVELQIAN